MTAVSQGYDTQSSSTFDAVVRQRDRLLQETQRLRESVEAVQAQNTRYREALEKIVKLDETGIDKDGYHLSMDEALGEAGAIARAALEPASDQQETR